MNLIRWVSFNYKRDISDNLNPSVSLYVILLRILIVGKITFFMLSLHKYVMFLYEHD